MREVVIHITVILYALSILFVLFHSLFDAHLIFHYLVSRKKKKALRALPPFEPFVTIQLPVYNEMHVIERLLDAVSRMNYPLEKMEVQVLDDSTDETSALIARKIQALHQIPVSFHHIQRVTRDGFKAGALKHAMGLAKGDFIVVFDADFLPSPDFLKKTISFFSDASIGMVQTNWSHLNKETSLLTRLQAIALDGHFSIEQQGRNAGGYFINFNGTAGVWRKQTILDAGNWQADTLTEDFDLSYRAQMKGWKFKYLEDYNTPAELPPVVSALKSQQFRWTKGGAETARKHLISLFRSPLPLSVKLHGAFHLIYSFGFISIITYALLSVPILYIREFYPQYKIVFQCSRLIGFSFFIYVLHYFISYYHNTKGSFLKKWIGFVFHFPLFVSLFIGLSLSNAIGIMQGYMGIKSGFVRTPKFNLMEKKKEVSQSAYSGSTFSWLTLMEGLLIFYFMFGIVKALGFENYASIPLLSMAFIGFTMMFWMSVQEVGIKSGKVHE